MTLFGIVTVSNGELGSITSSPDPGLPSCPGSDPCVTIVLQMVRPPRPLGGPPCRLASYRMLNASVIVCPSSTFCHLPPEPVGMFVLVLQPPVNTPFPAGRVVGVELAGSFLTTQSASLEAFACLSVNDCPSLPTVKSP